MLTAARRAVAANARLPDHAELSATFQSQFSGGFSGGRGITAAGIALAMTHDAREGYGCLPACRRQNQRGRLRYVVHAANINRRLFVAFIAGDYRSD